MVVGRTFTYERCTWSPVPAALTRWTIGRRSAIVPEAFLAGLPTPVLIDEWQIAGTDLLWTLERLVDAGPTPRHFILTGSVEPATYGPTYPFVGRAVRLVMRPTTMSELDGRGGQAASSPASQRANVRHRQRANPPGSRWAGSPEQGFRRCATWRMRRCSSRATAHRSRNASAIVGAHPPTVRTHRRHQRVVGTDRRGNVIGGTDRIRTCGPCGRPLSRRLHSSTLPPFRSRG